MPVVALGPQPAAGTIRQPIARAGAHRPETPSAIMFPQTGLAIAARTCLKTSRKMRAAERSLSTADEILVRPRGRAAGDLLTPASSAANGAETFSTTGRAAAARQGNKVNKTLRAGPVTINGTRARHACESLETPCPLLTRLIDRGLHRACGHRAARGCVSTERGRQRRRGGRRKRYERKRRHGRRRRRKSWRTRRRGGCRRHGRRRRVERRCRNRGCDLWKRGRDDGRLRRRHWGCRRRSCRGRPRRASRWCPR